MGKKLAQYISTENEDDLTIDEQIVKINNEPADAIFGDVTGGVTEALEAIEEILDSQELVASGPDDLAPATEALAMISVRHIASRLRVLGNASVATETVGLSKKSIAIEGFLEVVSRVWEAIGKALRAFWEYLFGTYDEKMNEELVVNSARAHGEVEELGDKITSGLVKTPEKNVVIKDAGLTAAFADLSPVVAMKELLAHITSLRVNDDKLCADMQNIYTTIIGMKESFETVARETTPAARQERLDAFVTSTAETLARYYGDKRAIYPSFSKSDLNLDDMHRAFGLDIHTYVDSVSIGGMFANGDCIVVMEKKDGGTDTYFPCHLKSHGKHSILHAVDFEDAKTYSDQLSALANDFSDNSKKYRLANSMSGKLTNEVLDAMANLAMNASRAGDTDFAKTLTELGKSVLVVPTKEIQMINRTRKSLYDAIGAHQEYLSHVVKLHTGD